MSRINVEHGIVQRGRYTTSTTTRSILHCERHPSRAYPNFINRLLRFLRNYKSEYKTTDKYMICRFWYRNTNTFI